MDSDRPYRASWIALAGWAIILMSAGATFLPALGRAQGSLMVGLLLLGAGIAEMTGGYFRREVRALAMATGALTAALGLIFLFFADEHFTPVVNIVIVWLIARSIFLFITSRRASPTIRRWILLSAATDFVLGILIMLGLSIATLVITLFGPTPALVASFAWVLALSFVTDGILLLEIASCEREACAGEA